MENTEISWADNTFNPWIGCTKVGPGCDHCYAETFNNRFHGGNWGPGAPRRRTSESNWKKPLKWNREAAEKGIRSRVFCASLADVFDNEVPDLWRYDLFKLIIDTPNLDWLVLTKRIGNAAKILPEIATRFDAMLDSNDRYKPLPNLWLGATIVNQQEADRDIPKLLSIPARIRFLSMEPLLEAVDLVDWFEYRNTISGGTVTDRKSLNWVIVGGESGSNARPMHPEWVRSLRDQCQSAGVAYHFKQWGEWSPRAMICGAGQDFQTIDPKCKRWPDIVRIGEHGKDTRQMENCTEDAGEEVYVQRVGKANSGRTLDGRTWDEFPASTGA